MSYEATVLVFFLIHLTAMYNSFPVWFRSTVHIWNLLLCAVSSQCQERTAAGEKNKFFMPFKFLKSFPLYIDKISVQKVQSSHRYKLNVKPGE